MNSFPAKVRLQLVRESEPYNVQINNPADANRLVQSYLANASRERLIAFYLTADLKLLGIEEVSIGTASYAPASAAEIMKGALLSNASKLIVAHNHPGSVATPSKDDEQFTKNLMQACEMFEMSLLDHFIVAGSRTISMRESGFKGFGA
jgi:DNA repair protein RadC